MSARLLVGLNLLWVHATFLVLVVVFDRPWWSQVALGVSTLVQVVLVINEARKVDAETKRRNTRMVTW